jgi:hypothetical protein
MYITNKKPVALYLIFTEPFFSIFVLHISLHAQAHITTPEGMFKKLVLLRVIIQFIISLTKRLIIMPYF